MKTLNLKGKRKDFSLHNTILSVDKPTLRQRTIFVDKAFLTQKYIKERLSCQEIANLLGNVTRQGVWKAIKRFGVKPRSKADAIFYENGERCKVSQGYFWIYRPNHPRANNKYVKRCVLVLGEKLGRSLQPGELPHHKDLNRMNDNPNNLELSNRSDHPKIHFSK